MKNKMSVIVKTVLLVFGVILTTAGTTFCPWDLGNNGECGSWRVYTEPDRCYIGECRANEFCRYNHSGHGAYLYCEQTNVACNATVYIYGNTNCTDLLEKNIVACNAPNATFVNRLVGCPD